TPAQLLDRVLHADGDRARQLLGARRRARRREERRERQHDDETPRAAAHARSLPRLAQRPALRYDRAPMKPKLRVWVTFGDELKFGDGRARPARRHAIDHGRAAVRRAVSPVPRRARDDDAAAVRTDVPDARRLAAP